MLFSREFFEMAAPHYRHHAAKSRPREQQSALNRRQILAMESL